MTVVSPAVAGALSLSPAAALTASAASSVATALGACGLRLRPAPERAVVGGGHAARHRPGVRFATAVGVLAVSQAIATVGGALVTPLHRVSGLDVGFMYSAWAVGGFLAALAGSTFARPSTRHPGLLPALVVLAVAESLTPLARTAWVAAAVTLAVGAVGAHIDLRLGAVLNEYYASAPEVGWTRQLLLTAVTSTLTGAVFAVVFGVVGIGASAVFGGIGIASAVALVVLERVSCPPLRALERWLLNYDARWDLAIWGMVKALAFACLCLICSAMRLPPPTPPTPRPARPRPHLETGGETERPVRRPRPGPPET
jgi:hypothetical protein